MKQFIRSHLRLVSSDVFNITTEPRHLHTQLASLTLYMYVIPNWSQNDCVMSKSLPSGKLLRNLFASLLSFALSSKMQSKIFYGEEFDRYKIHHADKICLELGTFVKFAKL